MLAPCWALGKYPRSVNDLASKSAFAGGEEGRCLSGIVLRTYQALSSKNGLEADALYSASRLGLAIPHISAN